MVQTRKRVQQPSPSGSKKQKVKADIKKDVKAEAAVAETSRGRTRSTLSLRKGPSISGDDKAPAVPPEHIVTQEGHTSGPDDSDSPSGKKKLRTSVKENTSQSLVTRRSRRNSSTSENVALIGSLTPTRRSIRSSVASTDKEAGIQTPSKNSTRKTTTEVEAPETEVSTLQRRSKRRISVTDTNPQSTLAAEPIEKLTKKSVEDSPRVQESVRRSRRRSGLVVEFGPLEDSCSSTVSLSSNANEDSNTNSFEKLSVIKESDEFSKSEDILIESDSTEDKVFASETSSSEEHIVLKTEKQKEDSDSKVSERIGSLGEVGPSQAKVSLSTNSDDAVEDLELRLDSPDTEQSKDESLTSESTPVVLKSTNIESNKVGLTCGDHSKNASTVEGGLMNTEKNNEQKSMNISKRECDRKEDLIGRESDGSENEIKSKSDENDNVNERKNKSEKLKESQGGNDCTDRDQPMLVCLDDEDDGTFCTDKDQPMLVCLDDEDDGTSIKSTVTDSENEVTIISEKESSGSEVKSEVNGKDMVNLEVSIIKNEKNEPASTHKSSPVKENGASETCKEKGEERKPVEVEVISEGVKESSITMENLETKILKPNGADSAQNAPDQVKSITRGLPISGRWWKQEKQRFRTVYKDATGMKSWAKKMERKKQRKEVLARSAAIESERQRKREELKERQKLNKIRREENAKKSEIVQVIKDPRKIKKMKKKQLRYIQTRDLTPQQSGK